MLSIGESFLTKIIETKNYAKFGKINREWLLKEEQESYDYIDNFVKRYNSFPSQQTFRLENSIPDEPIVEPLQYYLDRIIKRYTNKVLESKLPRLNLLLTKNNPSKVIDLLASIVKEINKIKLSFEDILSYKEILDLALKESLNLRTKSLRGITTGWEYLDRVTNGFTPGNLFVIVARMKLGKSLIMLKMAKAAIKENKKAMFISLEMPTLEMGNRLLAMEYGVRKQNIEKGKLSTPLGNILKANIEKITDNDNFKFIGGAFKRGITDLAYMAREIKPDIIFVDGAYLLQTKMGKSKWEAVSYITEELKGLAMSMSIPIVASYQFNREVSRGSKSIKSDGIDKIGLSDSIAQLASIVIAILQDKGCDDIRNLEIIGGRNGASGSLAINWDWDTMKFDEAYHDE